MQHADKFTDRILFLDGFPNMQVLDPLRIGQNVKESLNAILPPSTARARFIRKPQPTAMASRLRHRATCSRA